MKKRVGRRKRRRGKIKQYDVFFTHIILSNSEKYMNKNGFVKVVMVEDLRAWLENTIKKYDSPNNMHFSDKKIIARMLLAELSKTGGPKATREKPPPRSFL